MLIKSVPMILLSLLTAFSLHAADNPKTPPAASLALKATGFRQLTKGGLCSSPSFSPRGDRIAYFQRTTVNNKEHILLRIVKITGGDPVTIAREEAGSSESTLELSSGFGAKWSPDGTQILYKADSDSHHDVPGFAAGLMPGACYVIYANGINRRKLSDNFVGSAEWSPNGKLIAFSTISSEGALKGEVWISEPGGAARKVLDKAVTSLSWSPDGSKLAFMTMNPEQSSGILDIASKTVTQIKGITDVLGSSIMWTREGLVSSLFKTSLVQFDNESKQPVEGCDLAFIDFKQGIRTLTRNGGSILPSISPDGRYVAFIRNHPLKADSGEVMGTVSSLWATDTRNGRQSLICSYADADSRPSWAPNSGLAFTWQKDIWLTELIPQTVSSVPNLSAAEQAKLIHTVNNIKQIGLGLIMYAADHNNLFPSDPSTLKETLMPYIKNEEVFNFPDSRGPMDIRYLVPGINLGSIRNPAETVIAEIGYDAARTVNLYADGHVAIRNP